MITRAKRLECKLLFFTIIISFVNEFMDFVLACAGKKFAWKHKIEFEKAA